MSDLKEFRLEEITKFIFDCPHSTPEWTDEGVIVLRNQNIRNGKLDLSSPSFTNNAGYEARIKRALPVFGDIVLTREAPMGEVCMVPENLKCCLGQRMVLIRPDLNFVDGRYLLFAFQGPALKHQIGWNQGTGTTVSNIRIPNIKGFRFKLPSLLEQKAIAHILGTLDDKIELNRQMNQTLEAVAQALFKSWFVDFDPVLDNALAAGREIPDELQAMAEKRRVIANREARSGKQSHRLIYTNPELATKFPSSFVYNETLGKWIPEGWELKTIGDITDKVTDGTHSTVKDDPDGNCFLLSCKNIKHGQILITENDRRINLQTLQQLRKRTGLQINDVLLTTVGTIGEVALVTKAPNNYELQRSVAIIRGADSKVLHHFLHQYIRSRFFQNEALNRSKGSVQTCLFLGAINSVPTLMPSFNLIKSFQRIIESYQLKIGLNQEQIETLTQLRDRLLPELISGKVRVLETEELIEQELNMVAERKGDYVLNSTPPIK